MENPDDVVNPFMWLGGADGDGVWNDLLSMIFSGSAWPEGSETAVWDLAEEWVGLAHGLADSSDMLQAAAADLLAAWDAPAAVSFDDLARQLLGSPDFGLPGHVQNASAVARQVSGFGVDLQYAKVSVNIAVAVAAIAAVIAIVMSFAGGLSLTSLGSIAQAARQAVIRALEQLAAASGRRAAVHDVGRAVAEAVATGTQRAAAAVASHSTGHHLGYEVAEEMLEELVIDVGTQGYQVSEGTRTGWNGLSTVMSVVGGAVGGAVGAGLVAPVFARMRRSPIVNAVAGLGAEGRFVSRVGNVGIRHTGGLVATASTNAVASPVGGIAASLLTGQGFPALDGSTLGMAALGAVGRYGTVSPTNPAVLSAAVHPVQTLAKVHLDALTGHTAQAVMDKARADAVADRVHSWSERSPAGSTPSAAATGRTTVPWGAPVVGPGPATTAPGTTAPGTTMPGTAAPGVAAPATAVPGTAAPASSAPATTPRTTTPGTTSDEPPGTNPSGRPTAASTVPTSADPVTPDGGAASPLDPVDQATSTGAPAVERPQVTATPSPGAPASATGPAEPGTASPGAGLDVSAHGGDPAPVSGETTPAASDSAQQSLGPERSEGERDAGGVDRPADDVPAGTSPEPHGSLPPGAAAGPPPPVDPPATEQELFDQSPEAVQRAVVEAVADAQPWADLVLDQLGSVFDSLQADGFPRPHAVGVENAVKTVRSAARKIQPPVQGGSTIGSAFWSMDDLVRFSVQTDPSRYGDSVLATLGHLAQLGWAAPVPRPGRPAHDDWRNTWAPGNRHFGLLVVLTHTETGQRVEVQFPTPKSWALGKQTHGLYEVLRVRTNDPVERVVALARIREAAVSVEADDRFPRGLGELGFPKSNGPAQVFGKEPSLAAEFVALSEHRYGSPMDALLDAGIPPSTARGVVDAALLVINSSAEEQGDDRDGSATPGVADLGEGAAQAPGELGALSRDRSGGGEDAGPVPPPGGGSRAGTVDPTGAPAGRGDRAGEGLRVQDRDLAEAVGPADPGDPLGGGRGTGGSPVQRAERDLDLRPGQPLGDRAPGGRGPLRAAGAGDPGPSGRGSPQEGDDAAQPGTPAGDLPEPGGPGTGDVGYPVGPGTAQRGELTGPLAVGADAAQALAHVLEVADAPVLWLGADGALPGRVLMLADGSTIRVNTGDNPWATTEPDRPLQMWTVGALHLDDGPLTPAASAFLADLARALQDPDVGGRSPSSVWLSQRATLDPRTHEITEPGVARPRDGGDDVRVWDAAQGWVDARRAGGLARVVDEGLVTAGDYDSWTDQPLAGQVLEGAARLTGELQRSRDAEVLAAVQPGTPQHAAAVAARAAQRVALREAAAEWAASTVTPGLALALNSGVRVLGGSGSRLLVELDHGQLAVVAVAVAENDALEGSRPGLQQVGTAADIGRLRNELARMAITEEDEAVVRALTRELQQGAVRHFRVQGVLTDQEFVGTRVTEFEVTQPAHDQPDVLRSRVEPHRHIDPGLSTREAMQRAMAGWTPASVTEAIANALRWLPFVNPHHDAFPVTDRMPWSNNCGDCSRAVADLLHGRDARAAFGDNGARVRDSWRVWGTGPGELNEMWRWAGTRPGWHSWPELAPTYPAQFTTLSTTRIGQALSTRPVGTVAIVLVNWADQNGMTVGGHWFNAAVTEDGVEWIDGQTAEHHAWPPPYSRPYSGYSVIVREQGSDSWRDLLGGGGGPAVPGGAGSGGASQAPQHLLGPADAAFAARLANASGEPPDEEDEVLGGVGESGQHHRRASDDHVVPR